MKSFKGLKVFAIGLGVLMLVGCGPASGEGGVRKDLRAGSGQTGSEQGESGRTADGGRAQDGGQGDAEDLYSLAAAAGNVVEFTETGCTVSPSVSENVDGGEICYGAAPGMEDEEKNITVTYRPDCVFQKVVINYVTGEKSVSEAKLSDVLKQSSLLIFGEFQDEKNILADKIMITRYEGGAE